MLRIGEAAKQFNISNRTLRHWEDMGILKSTRAENDYRYYDNENVMRIHQIVLLRKLKMPIADIERIFIAGDFAMAIDVLSSHLEHLKQDTAIYHALIDSMERLITHIKGARNLKQVFSYLEAQNAIMDARHDSVLQIRLPERTNLMLKESLNHVRIVRLPAMTVAAYRVESATPEEDCSKVFDPFVFENNLHKRSGYRYFGFNNPDPSEDSPIYGYELWVTIPEDFDVPPPFEKKQFGGGLFASIPATVHEIGERWELLYNWLEKSDKYEYDSATQWLEECSMDLETFLESSNDGKQLDLLMPISKT